MSDFKAGDKVKDQEGTEYAVEDGPQTCYKIRAAGAESMWLPASSLSPAPPEDPRLPVMAAALEARDTGVAVSYWDLAVAALEALDATPPAPLKNGDKVRVLRAYLGWESDETCTVLDAELDEDGDFRVIAHSDGRRGYLPMGSEGSTWKRA